MSILYLLIPLGLLLLGAAIWAFFWAVGSGQFDDLDSPAWTVVMDDDKAPKKVSSRQPAHSSEREYRSRMTPELILPAAFAAGFFGSTHCLAMCGAIVLLFEGSGQNARGNLPRRIAYNVGRLLFYMLLGARGGCVRCVADRRSRYRPWYSQNCRCSTDHHARAKSDV